MTNETSGPEHTDNQSDSNSQPDQGDDVKKRAMRRYVQMAKYSGMALQFFLLIFIAAWAGQKLDEYFSTPKPYLTVALVIFFSAGYFVKLYKDLTS